MQCPNCGELVADGAAFCPNCGTPLVASNGGAQLGMSNSAQGRGVRGVEVRAENLTRYRGIFPKRRRTNDNISLCIEPGEFVAIIGGSGSGKSTLLNELNGREPADEGRVYINGVDLYANFEALRGSIGFVPQQDIIHDDLTLADTLAYAARMRMPHDTSDEARQERITDVLKEVHLEEETSNMIRNLSGGQKKRASIAVELLSKPQLLFLDEPTSGLDPSLEQDFMKRLRSMSGPEGGRTIVIVTHTPANIGLCDKLVVLGRGGRLCYFGTPADVTRFFEVDDIVDVYKRIASEEGSVEWQGKYLSMLDGSEHVAAPATQMTAPVAEVEKVPVGRQLGTLVRRYAKLILNDPFRMALLIGQALLLACLIAFVTGDGCFKVYENTKSCLFALSCAAFWIGILDSIQEVCKERPIFERETDSGIRIPSYLLSKLVVLGVLCLVQAALFTITFACSMGVFGYAPSEPWFVPLSVQLFATSAFIMLSAMCLGLLVSSIFKNPDRAIACAPLLIMPQILFAGVVVELEGVVETISYFVTCRWGMSGYGTAAGLTMLQKALVGKVVNGTEVKASWDLSALSPAADEAMYGQGVFGILSAWSVMIVTSALFVGLCMLLLRIGVRKKR